MDTIAMRMELRRFLNRPSYRYQIANRFFPHIPWLILFALSVFLYKQRIFADSAYYVSHFINNKFFMIECQRYVLAFSQVLPLIGVWLGIKLKYVLLLYSISHVLFFYSLFLITYYGLRDRRSGLLILIFQITGITLSFYTPMFELFYGVSLLVTFYAFWRTNINSNFVLLLLIFLEITVLFSHPVTFILLAFIIFYDFREHIKPAKWYLWLIGILIAVAVTKSFFMCPYETGKLGWQFGVDENKTYLQLFKAGFWKHLAAFFMTYYPETMAALLGSIVLLTIKKQWFRLIVVAGTFSLYLVLVAAAYTEILHSRYMEQVFFPFVVISFIPIVYGYNSKMHQGLQNTSTMVLILLIGYRLFMIYDGSFPFRQRTIQMESLIHTAWDKGGTKYIIDEAKVEKEFTMLNWSYPIESMLISSLYGNTRTVTLVPSADLAFENNVKKITPRNFLYRKWEIRENSWLNPAYFHLDPGIYKPLADTLVNKNLNAISNSMSLNINALNYYQSLDTIWIPVEIINNSGITLKTGGRNQVYISYFWMHDDNLLDWNSIKTTVDCDITTKYTQLIKVATPAQKGKHNLKVDVIGDNNFWFGINATVPVYIY